LLLLAFIVWSQRHTSPVPHYLHANRTRNGVSQVSVSIPSHKQPKPSPNPSPNSARPTPQSKTQKQGNPNLILPHQIIVYIVHFSTPPYIPGSGISSPLPPSCTGGGSTGGVSVRRLVLRRSSLRSSLPSWPSVSDCFHVLFCRTAVAVFHQRLDHETQRADPGQPFERSECGCGFHRVEGIAVAVAVIKAV